MGLYTAQRTNVKSIVLQKPEGNRTANLVALNAAPLIKAARALDTFTFGWNAAVSAGSISEDDEDRAAFARILSKMQAAKPLTTEVPKGMDKSAVEALTLLVKTAAANENSPLSQMAAGLTIVEVTK